MAGWIRFLSVWSIALWMSAGLCGPLYSQTSVDEGFHVELLGTIESAASLGAGWTLLSGSFVSPTNQDGSHQVLRIWRDGSIDPSFRLAVDGSALSMAADQAGQLLLGGTFNSIGGVARSHLARVGADGTIDERFKPTVAGPVFSLLPFANGDILVGGEFNQINGQPRRHLARLHSNGTLDSGFDPSPDGPVRGLSLQEDGKMILIGEFSQVSGQSRPFLARIHPDGRLDSTFDARMEASVDSVLLQPDGRLIVGGQFKSWGGSPRAFLARLFPDGRLDETFQPSVSGPVRSLALQANGDLLIGGDFTDVGGQPRRGLAKLTMNGDLVPDFVATTGGMVKWMLLQQDGKVLAWSSWKTPEGTTSDRLIRLFNSEPATEHFTYANSRLRWMRGGSSPEVNRAAFDLFVPQSTWVELSVPVRISGGWEVSGLYFPIDRSFRAHGFLTTGGHFETQIETFVGPTQVYGLSVEPAPLETGPTPGGLQGRFWPERSAIFRIQAKGTPPISYQWLKDGVPLARGFNLAGVTSPTLHVGRLTRSDEGSYSVVVQSSSGSVTSPVVEVRLTGVVIVAQPRSIEGRLEQTVSLSVSAVGPRLRYQWLKDGLALENATLPQLDLVNLDRSNVGRYSVLVSNEYERTASVEAAVSILSPTVDRSFSSSLSLGERAMIWGIQADGKILVSTNRGSGRVRQPSNLVRLEEDGAIDPTFHPQDEGLVENVAFQTDGKLLILSYVPIDGPGGTAYARRLRRVLPNGLLDPEFHSQIFSDVTVEPMVLQQDGGILLGIGSLQGTGCASVSLVRFLPDGRLDPHFAQLALCSSSRIPFVSDIAVLPGGKILGAGNLVLPGERTPRNLLRFSPDGQLDTGFLGMQGGGNGTILLQADGKILYAEVFGVLSRFLPDGLLDQFYSSGPGAGPILLQADGRCLLLAGSGERMNSDGSADRSFRLERSLYSFVQDYEGRIVGEVPAKPGVDDSAVSHVRLKDTGPAVDRLLRDGTTLTWWRGGSSPEISFAEFEMTTDSRSWTRIGSPTRIPGGWRLSGVPDRPDVNFRALGMLPRSKGIVASVEPLVVDLNLGSPFVMAGEEGKLQLTLGTSLKLKRLEFVLETYPGLVGDLRAQPTSLDLEQVSWVSQSRTRTEIQCVAKAGRTLSGLGEIASLTFRTPADLPSQFLPLRIVEMRALIEDGTVARRWLHDPKRLAILNRQPLLEVIAAEGMKPQLVLYAKEGWRYRLQSNSKPGDKAWEDWMVGAVTSEITMIPIQPIGNRRYYRLATSLPVSEETDEPVKP